MEVNMWSLYLYCYWRSIY